MSGKYKEKTVRIAIVALGTLGDVAPYVALGQGFVAAGDAVKIVTFARFAPLARQYGLECCVVKRNLEAFLERDFTRFHVTARPVMQALRRMPQIRQEMQKQLEYLMSHCLEAFADVDLVIGQAIGHLAAWPLAQQLNIPYYAAYCAPLSRTRAFPNAFAGDIFPPGPGWRRWKGSYNWWTHTLSARLFWARMSPMLRKALQAVLKQPAGALNPGVPVLYGYSPALLPKPADWGAHIAVTGSWQLKQLEDWQPPSELVTFLDAGPPPVYVGFGSMAGQAQKKAVHLSVQALQALRMRCVLMADRAAWPELHDCADIFFLPSAPHSWLFPRMAAIMHHGGAGTTATALRAGLPQIIVPFIADQSFWGHLVAISGIGPAPLQHKTMQLEHVRDAIVQAVTDPQMRLCARNLSETVHSEDGVARAVEIVHAFMRTLKSEELPTLPA